MTQLEQVVIVNSIFKSKKKVKHFCKCFIVFKINFGRPVLNISQKNNYTCTEEGINFKIFAEVII